jgi:hypothetical protein
METTNNYIDDLVRKSFPDKITSPDDAALWDRIDKTMKYKRFLRFSLSNFNIYYSVLIILLISSAAYFFINNNSRNTAPINNNSILPVPIVKDIIQPEFKNDKTINPSVSSIRLASGQNTQSKLPGKSDTNSLPVIKNKTEKPSYLTGEISSKKTKKVKVVKKQFVITDTIYKEDTVYIKKALLIPK